MHAIFADFGSDGRCSLSSGPPFFLETRIASPTVRASHHDQVEATQKREQIYQ